MSLKIIEGYLITGENKLSIKNKDELESTGDLTEEDMMIK